MVVLALVVMGMLARNQMPKEAQPDVEMPFMSVVTAYPGAGPSEVETLISKPLEDAVAGINGLKHVTSTSRDGLSVVGLEFELGTNLDVASADVRDKVAAAGNVLPRDAADPTVSRVNFTSGPIMTIGMAGSLPPEVMRHLADTTIKDAFAKVPGVAAVYVDGGRIREIQVEVDKNRLQAYGMSLSQVVDAINSQNINLPSGTIKETGQEYAVRMVGEFTSPAQIENVQIQVPSRSMGGKANIVRLGDVAKVTDTVQDPDRLTRLGIGSQDPIPAVDIAIQKQSGGNTVAVAEGVKHEMARLLGKHYNQETNTIDDTAPGAGVAASTRILPQGLDMIIATDESENVLDSLNDVNKTLIEGVILVVIIVFLFLHSARATFIVALAIPTSIFATFLPLSVLGYSLNFMTLLGLSLAVGILVDDSIVVLENIERHLRLGEPPDEAALNGRSEIGLAAIAITLVDVVVFIPIANMGGIVGQFFRPFGWTVAIAALFSLFMSFTLTPMMASRFFKAGHGSEEEKREARGFWAGVFRRFDNFYRAMDLKYEGLLAWTLENRALAIWTGWAALFTVIAMLFPPGAGKLPLVIIVAVMIGLGTLFSRDRITGLLIGVGLIVMMLVVHLPLSFGFFPTADQGVFSVTLEGAPGQSLAVTDRAVAQVSKAVQSLKDDKTGKPILKYQIATAGASSSGASQGAGDAGSQYGNINVQLVDKDKRSESVEEVVRRLTILTANVPGAKIIVSQPSGIGGKPITEEVSGPDMEQNIKTANLLLAKMAKVPGVVDAESDWKSGKPELQINVDQDRAADRGLTAAQVGNAARIAIQGSGDSGLDTKYRESGDQYTIRVQYEKLDRNSPSEIGGLVVGSNQGQPVYLRDVATITNTIAPNAIKRKDKQRLITVDANVAAGYSQGNVQAAVTEVAKTIPTGTSVIRVGGTGQVQDESAGYMGAALGLAVILVYMLMAALFESLTTPFVIWLALPQALIGALLGLMVTNKALSVVSMIGIIMLMGLVTKNAILLIDYTNTLRARGKSRREAILEAGPTRLRPILMTTFAMIGGMLPTALAVSRGSEQRQPMAIAVIGGLALSTVLTLLVIPATYALMDDIVSGTHRRWVGLIGRRGKEEPRRIEKEPVVVGGE
jgi:HAE1 family hydrophobic/amphiphilic exporter-1